MRMQMSPNAAIRRGARSVGNAASQFAQAPANYLGQVGQSVGNAFNRATQTPSASMPLPQTPTPRNSPWLANPNFQPGMQKMPLRYGQAQNSPYQLNPQYRGNGLQTADIRQRSPSEEMYLRNPNYRSGAVNTPSQFAPGQTRQSSIDQLLSTPSASRPQQNPPQQSATSGVRNFLGTVSNLPAIPAQQMGVRAANTFNQTARGVADFASASPMAAAATAAGRFFSRQRPTTPAPASQPAPLNLSTAGQNFRNRIREEKWQPGQPLPQDWFEQRMRSNEVGSDARGRAEYEAAGGFQRMGLAGHAAKYGPKERIGQGI